MDLSRAVNKKLFMYDDNDVIRKENYPENFYTLSLFAASCRSRFDIECLLPLPQLCDVAQEWKTTNFFCFLIMNLLNSNFMIIFIFRSHTKRHTEAVAWAKRARLLEIEIKGDNGKSRRGKKCVQWCGEGSRMTTRWWKQWHDDDGMREAEMDGVQKTSNYAWKLFMIRIEKMMMEVMRENAIWTKSLTSPIHKLIDLCSETFDFRLCIVSCLSAPSSAVYERDWYA